VGRQPNPGDGHAHLPQGLLHLSRQRSPVGRPEREMRRGGNAPAQGQSGEQMQRPGSGEVERAQNQEPDESETDAAHRTGEMWRRHGHKGDDHREADECKTGLVGQVG